MRIAFTIYGDPKAKGRPRHTKNGHTFTPAETEEAERNFRAQAITYRPEGGPIPLKAPIRLTLKFFLQTPASLSAKKAQLAEEGVIRPTGRPDLDNLIKLSKDAFKSVFWGNDSQVVTYGEGTAKYYSKTPRTEVEIETL